MREHCLTWLFGNNPFRSQTFHRRVFSFAEMIVRTVDPTDLITPLGGYLRLRETETAAFVLESVEKGRSGVLFHPGSVLTPVGPDLAPNFLEAT